ncbi:putative membrane protein (DUF2078) [Desulfosporosinus acidiphilus SJ4]|uniref:Putative membrane protein (DUF2078) n=1 Tax=Desulfosporosinus acidiphilus (strain DSM 22704 / JCM 16185 / SJ4) TaxID=646529 RepID=I4D1Y7_DESAJ|nr:SHOCT domain-containing protein [Desulfosporosinus acidiphilus]AFM39811.1 putative membrane protein (DUF2078) [Desulfosporosinus acidiphilus SJ4]
MMFGFIVIIIVIYLIYRESNSGVLFSGKSFTHSQSPLDILDQRYARGEIQREEYLERKEALLGRKQTVSLEKK